MIKQYIPCQNHQSHRNVSQGANLDKTQDTQFKRTIVNMPNSFKAFKEGTDTGILKGQE